MSRNKIGVVCMIAGAVLISSALLLLIYNNSDNKRAEASAQSLLADVKGVILDDQMSETKEINGYIGYLSIPSLNLELPVMSEWDYDRLKSAPCRQFGSVENDDLVIAGHNYRSHFGSLSQLCTGDLVQFTEMNGKTIHYSVETINVITPDSTEEVQDSVWDLILYTCTYNGLNRIMVGGKRI